MAKSKSGPGKSYRQGINIIQLFDMFPDEESARIWFENIRWPDGGRRCPRCDSIRTMPTKEREAHALLVLWVPFVLQRQGQHHHGGQQATAPQVGLRAVPAQHEPQEGVQHEATPRRN